MHWNVNNSEKNVQFETRQRLWYNIHHSLDHLLSCPSTVIGVLGSWKRSNSQRTSAGLFDLHDKMHNILLYLSTGLKPLAALQRSAADLCSNFCFTHTHNTTLNFMAHCKMVQFLQYSVWMPALFTTLQRKLQ